MNTLIHLLSVKQQMAFLEKNMDKHLRVVLNYSNPLIIHVVKEILGEAFKMMSHGYRVNIDILAEFFTTIIKVIELKVTARCLCKKMVDNSPLGDIANVVSNIDDCFTIPWPNDYFLRWAGRVVPKMPTLSGFFVDEFKGRRNAIIKHIRFIQKVLDLKFKK